MAIAWLLMVCGAVGGAWADHARGSDRALLAMFGGASGGFFGTLFYFLAHPPIAEDFWAVELAIIGIVTGWILRSCVRRVASRRKGED